jgi:hypothetical protein
MKITLRLLVLAAFAVMVACSTGNSDKSAKKKPATLPEKISDDSLFTLVQYRTFQYFWDGAEPVSGGARERFHVDGVYPENDMNVITSGGTCFGVMAILAGIERGFITREEGLARLQKLVAFLGKADRFHGAWPHWIYGETGRVKPFSPNDNGADLVETAYLIQGLLAAKEYFANGIEPERKLTEDIDRLWREVEWFTKRAMAIAMVFDLGWKKLSGRGYNECLFFMLVYLHQLFRFLPLLTAKVARSRIVTSAKWL